MLMKMGNVRNDAGHSSVACWSARCPAGVVMPSWMLISSSIRPASSATVPPCLYLGFRPGNATQERLIRHLASLRHEVNSTCAAGPNLLLHLADALRSAAPLGDDVVRDHPA